MALDGHQKTEITPGLSAGDISEYFQKVVEIAPAIIYVFNQEAGRNEYSNRDIGETLGFSETEVLEKGENLMAELLHPEDAPGVFAHFSKIKTLGDDDTCSVEYRMRHKAGHWVWLLSKDAVFRRNSKDEVTHHIGAAVDISAQKAAELTALSAEAQARTVNEELRDFSYSVSHDLKAPTNTLQLLLGELETEADSLSAQGRSDLITDANKTVLSMKTLIDDVLHYTEVIGQDIEFVEVSLSVLMRDVVSGLRADILGTSAVVEVSDLPTVRGIPTQLTILFQNLLLNALKFSRPGVTPVVSVSAEMSVSGESCNISVRDNGIGIPEAKRDEIFHLFSRINSGPEFDGTGVGLAICRRVSRNHNSDIQVASVQNQGSEFSITLETT